MGLFLMILGLILTVGSFGLIVKAFCALKSDRLDESFEKASQDQDF